METNFFTALSSLNVIGHWVITIDQDATNKLIVSALLRNDQCGDQASRLITPMIFEGSAEDLNNGFFNEIAAPAQVTSGLFVNMEGYLKSQEEAMKQAAMNKPKPGHPKTEKEKKYEAAMQKADRLEAEQKFREAWMAVPAIEDYPDKTDEIRERKESLSAQFPTDLFNC